MENKKPSIAISVLLNLIAPGFGYIYIGLLRQGIISFALMILLAFAYSSSLVNTFTGFASISALLLVLYFFILIHCFIKAKKMSASTLKNFQQKRFLIPIFIVFLLTNGIGYKLPKFEGFEAPAGSMCPSLIKGDRFMVLKNVSFAKGDMVVFKSPKDPTISFVKRVVGFPGDKIEITNGELVINGKSIITKKTPFDSSVTFYCDQDFIMNGASLYTARVEDKEFTLAVDGHTNNDYTEYTIPKNEYYVIGDNWNNSFDSRFISTIPKENIIGKALYIYFSSYNWKADWSRIGAGL